MYNFVKLLFSSVILFTFINADNDCPSDSSYHVDMRTMLPDGSPNPSYGQQISTGLCACVTFEDGIEINGNEITFTISIVDNEPIRGVEFDIHHDFPGLSYENVFRGEKLQGLVNDQGISTSDMTLLGNSIDEHVKVLAYSVNRARTSGNGEKGDLLYLTYTLADGALLPDYISFYFTVINIPGTSAGTPPGTELLNVICNIHDQDNPVVVNTTTAATENDIVLPEVFSLYQNYPNPFNPSTQISFDVPTSEFITLRVYNLLGQDVRTLVSKIMNPGRYTFNWDGKDILNGDAASGVYFYELRSESFTNRKKMLLLR